LAKFNGFFADFLNSSEKSFVFFFINLRPKSYREQANFFPQISADHLIFSEAFFILFLRQSASSAG